MREVTRIARICGLLLRVWPKYPDLRLGQLLHLAAGRGGEAPGDLFYVEDDVFERGLRALVEEKKA